MSSSQSRPVAAIFDLDDTLIDGDSDYLWGEYLCDIGVVDATHHREQNRRFLDDYHRGELDIDAYHAFQLAPLARHPLEILQRWRTSYVAEVVAPRVFGAGRALLREHAEAGHLVLIATATNRFVTAPIAAELGVDTLLAADIEVINGRCTGRMADPPCQGPGKRDYVERWATDRGIDLNEAWFYSDSRNDLPLLERVGHPVATNPDDTLGAVARERSWQMLNFRLD